MYKDCIILFISLSFVILSTLVFNRMETYQDPKIDKIKHNLMQIDPQVASKLTIQASNQSFTEDKKDMYLCLKDKTGNYYNDNMLNYVAIHELAHAKSKNMDPGHNGAEFHNNFENYLKIAQDKGIYDPSIPLVENYCGVTRDMK